MTEQISKARERAENAFGKAQSQFLERNRIIDEHTAEAHARDEKTLKLRQLRKEKEAADLAAGIRPKGARKGR